MECGVRMNKRKGETEKRRQAERDQVRESEGRGRDKVLDKIKEGRQIIDLRVLKILRKMKVPIRRWREEVRNDQRF